MIKRKVSYKLYKKPYKMQSRYDFSESRPILSSFAH